MKTIMILIVGRHRNLRKNVISPRKITVLCILNISLISWAALSNK